MSSFLFCLFLSIGYLWSGMTNTDPVKKDLAILHSQVFAVGGFILLEIWEMKTREK